VAYCSPPSGTSLSTCIACGGFGVTFGGGRSDNGPTIPGGPPKKDCCTRCHDGKAAGQVCCCDGGLTICTYPDKLDDGEMTDYTLSALESCVAAHEQKHIDCGHAYCTPEIDGVAAPWTPGVDPKEAEVEGACAEIACLELAQSFCILDPQDLAFCSQDIQSRIGVMEDYAKANGGECP